MFPKEAKLKLARGTTMFLGLKKLFLLENMIILQEKEV
jgi:hypothetical protein